MCWQANKYKTKNFPKCLHVTARQGSELLLKVKDMGLNWGRCSAITLRFMCKHNIKLTFKRTSKYADKSEKEIIFGFERII